MNPNPAGELRARAGRVVSGRVACLLGGIALCSAGLALLVAIESVSTDRFAVIDRSDLRHAAERSSVEAMNAGMPGLPLMAPQRLYASGGNPLSDSDKDLLPDLCEWVALSRPDMADSDQDGTGDFVEALEYGSPLTPGPSRPATYAVRLLMHTAYEGQASERVWLHVLMRLPSGRLSDIQGFGLFIDQQSSRIPLSSLLATSLRELKFRTVRGQGLLVRLSFRLPLDLNSNSIPKVPAVFSCYAKLGKDFLSSGSLILPMAGLNYTVAVDAGQRILQTTNAASSNHPFWSASSTCVMQLEVHGVGTAGVLCEIKKAKCETAQYLRCAPGCAQAEGMTFFVPDGLGLICGG